METIEKIFNILAQSSESVSGEELGEYACVSRAAVKKCITKLQDMGIEITSSRKGYKYTRSDTLTPYTLKKSLEDAGVDIRVKYVYDTISTNIDARNYATHEDYDYVCVAAMQSSGKGRIGRKFDAKEGGVYVTLAIRPKHMVITDSLKLVLLSGIAVARTLEFYGLKPTIKWPNDVFVEGRKICGILLESILESEYVDRVFLGIGINVNNSLDESLKDVAVNTKELLGKALLREEVITHLLSNLTQMIEEYEREGFVPFEEEYIAKSMTIGRVVTVSTKDAKITGEVTGLTKEGYLLMNVEGEKVTVFAGDVGV